MPPPVVALSGCTKHHNGLVFDWAGRKYSRAVADAAGALPLVLPALGPEIAGPESVLPAVDGLLFTGSPTDVAPHHYEGEEPEDGGRPDHDRDATVLPLLRAALAGGVPVLAICRGFQEMNVALGGSLYQEVHAVPGHRDHREDEDLDPDGRYAPAHPVTLAAGGPLATMLGGTTFTVNSLHGQGIARLAGSLSPQAWADDGLVEAAVAADAPAFAWGVQWHPEWKATETPHARQLFAAFGAACRRRAQTRHHLE